MRGATVTVVGAESLVGREVRDILASRVPHADVKMVGAGKEGVGIISEDAGEPVYISPLEREYLAGADMLVLAGPPRSARAAYEMISGQAEAPAVIDLSYGLEDNPDARLRAPLVEPIGYQVPPRVVHVIAHPAAQVLARFQSRLPRDAGLKRSVALILEPASERGSQGVEELQKQTVALLSLRKLNKDVFDAQLGFNVLARYGSEAPEKLQEVELRIDRHLASLLVHVSGARMPSLRLVQVPVFHGYSLLIWAEFEAAPRPGALAEALASTDIEIRRHDEEPPSNVGIAGQSGITIGLIEADRNEPRACWFWVVADNLRISAESAVSVLEPLLEGGVRE
jgi:aspartate-semialdehyde dehydrogenase